MLHLHVAQTTAIALHALSYLSYQWQWCCWAEQTVSIWHFDLNKILPDLLKLNESREPCHTIFTTYISKQFKGTVWQQIMLLVNVFIKKLKSEKIQRILLQFQMYFFSDLHVIKHSYMYLSVYIDMIVTLFLVHNSLIFPHKKSVHLVYILFSLVSRKVFFLRKNTSI